jgi:hypothetical protein
MNKECLYYNCYNVPDLIKSGDKSVEPYLAIDYSDRVFDLYRKYNMDLTNVVCDRMDILPHYINIKKNQFPIPKIEQGFNLSFAECVEKRAKEILAHNKPVTVVWSGGIDSMLVVFALLQFCNDPSQITVHGTYNSIVESGNVFEKYILPRGVKYKFAPSARKHFTDDAQIYVTGFMGNQLFGPVDEFFYSRTTLFHHQFNGRDVEDPYQTILNDELHEFLSPSIKASPKKIETIRDLRWFCIFNFDWHTSYYDVLIKTNNYDKVHHFFNDDDMQRYVITTKEPFTKEKGNPLTHRWVMRELIEEWGKCSHYAWNKPKSVSNLQNRAADWYFLMSDHTTVTPKNIKIYDKPVINN